MIRVEEEAHSGRSGRVSILRSLAISSKMRSSSSVHKEAIIPAAVSVLPGFQPGGGPGSSFARRMTSTLRPSSKPVSLSSSMVRPWTTPRKSLVIFGPFCVIENSLHLASTQLPSTEALSQHPKPAYAPGESFP